MITDNTSSVAPDMVKNFRFRFQYFRKMKRSSCDFKILGRGGWRLIYNKLVYISENTYKDELEKFYAVWQLIAKQIVNLVGQY
jgi:hypothetical protein